METVTANKSITTGNLANRQSGRSNVSLHRTLCWCRANPGKTAVLCFLHGSFKVVYEANEEYREEGTSGGR